MVSGSQTRAIFAGAAGAKAVIAGEGARVGAYVVQSIGAGQVTLVGPDGPLVVRPAFDAAARSAALPVPAGPDTAVPAAELGRRKATGLSEGQPDIVATSNPGCMLQIRAAAADQGHSYRVLHIIELLDASISNRPIA